MSLQLAFVLFRLSETSKWLNLIKSKCVCSVIKSNCTWTKLFNAAVTAADVHRKHVLEPGDLRVRVSAGSTQHGGSSGPFNHLQLGTHINGGEAMGDLVFWKFNMTNILVNPETHRREKIKNTKQKKQNKYGKKILHLQKDSDRVASKLLRVWDAECSGPVELVRTGMRVKEREYF